MLLVAAALAASTAQAQQTVRIGMILSSSGQLADAAA